MVTHRPADPEGTTLPFTVAAAALAWDVEVVMGVHGDSLPNQQPALAGAGQSRASRDSGGRSERISFLSCRGRPGAELAGRLFWQPPLSEHPPIGLRPLGQLVADSTLVPPRGLSFRLPLCHGC